MLDLSSIVSNWSLRHLTSFFILSREIIYNLTCWNFFYNSLNFSNAVAAFSLSPNPDAVVKFVTAARISTLVCS